MTMRLLIAAVLAIAFVVPASACEACFEDYDGANWCEYCDYARCGYFNCVIKQYQGMGNMEYCTGDDAGCFEEGRGCMQEPQMKLQRPLGETWRLARVEVTPARKTVLERMPTRVHGSGRRRQS
ncbi:MAG TPA: hypothetical protein VF883_15380 [Thermoanaerobaculia bacterium]|jgi:hypothetical protein